MNMKVMDTFKLYFTKKGRKPHTCPVELAGSLDFRLRRRFQDPKNILAPYVSKGMTVLDMGCGPGFFSIDLAQMVGASGRVIAADLQAGMLKKLKEKIKGSDLEHRFVLHKCEENRIAVTEQIDFALMFYMVHEVSNKDAFFYEIHSILKPGAQALVVEPPFFHVSGKTFDNAIATAQRTGFTKAEGPKVSFSKTAILRKS